MSRRRTNRRKSKRELIDYAGARGLAGVEVTVVCIVLMITIIEILCAFVRGVRDEAGGCHAVRRVMTCV